MAIRSGRWKLHTHTVGKSGIEVCNELYDLVADIGETTNLYDQHPDIVADLNAQMDIYRKDLGDNLTGTKGENTRSVGRVDSSDTLTHYDPDHPYIIAMYDLKDRG